MDAVDVVLCRTCTNRERRTNMKDILTDHLSIHSFKMHMSIIEAFNEVTKMVVDENEPITTLICLNCVRRLRQAVVFRMTAAKSYETLSKQTDSNLYESTTYELKQTIKSEIDKEADYDDNIIEDDDDNVYQVEVATEESNVKEEKYDTKPDIENYIKVEVEVKKDQKQERRRPKVIMESPEPKRIRKFEIQSTPKVGKPIKETHYCAHCPATFTNKRNTFLHMKKLHMCKFFILFALHKP